jgi:hypothetical protein
MMGGNVAAGLLLAVCAFMLAFVPRRTGLFGLAVSVVMLVAVVAAGLALPVKWAFAGCWISLIVTAMLVYFPQGLRPWPWLAPIIAANAGFWAGQVIMVEGDWHDAMLVLPVWLVIIPAIVCVTRGWALPVRIVTSWLLAVALLVGSIPYLVVHPGYEADHKE